MSAWIVSKVHIDLMVKLVAEGTSDGVITPFAAALPVVDEVGQVLVNENVASVRHRYPDDKPGEEPGPQDAYYLKPYKYEDPGYRPTAAEALSLVRCYRYQSCEHPGWEGSSANATCEMVVNRVKLARPDVAKYMDDKTHRTPEPADFGACPWGWEVEDLEKRKGAAAAPDHVV